jgi:hypothetical protein
MTTVLETSRRRPVLVHDSNLDCLNMIYLREVPAITSKGNITCVYMLLRACESLREAVLKQHHGEPERNTVRICHMQYVQNKLKSCHDKCKLYRTTLDAY